MFVKQLHYVGRSVVFIPLCLDSLQDHSFILNDKATLAVVDHLKKKYRCVCSCQAEGLCGQM